MFVTGSVPAGVTGFAYIYTYIYDIYINRAIGGIEEWWSYFQIFTQIVNEYFHGPNMPQSVFRNFRGVQMSVLSHEIPA